MSRLYPEIVEFQVREKDPENILCKGLEMPVHLNRSRSAHPSFMHSGPSSMTWGTLRPGPSED
jgi:hypothetical protein